jgi:hypothetical protein
VIQASGFQLKSRDNSFGAAVNQFPDVPQRMIGPDALLQQPARSEG